MLDEFTELDDTVRGIRRFGFSSISNSIALIKITMKKYFMVVLASLACSSTFADGRDRILPSSITPKVTGSLRVDHPAFYLTVNNGTDQVVTSATFICDIRDRTKQRAAKAPNGKPWCGPNSFDVIGGQTIMLSPCEIDITTEYSVTDPILPGKSKEQYLERLRDSPLFTQCVLTEVRGREPKLLEKMSIKF